jgi:flagellar basal body rod protein FlgC
MNVGPIRGLAWTGLRDASIRLAVAAHNVASASTEGVTPARVVSSALAAGGVQTQVTLSVLEGVDLAAEMVAAKVAEAAFTASARVLEGSARLERTVLDLLA